MEHVSAILINGTCIRISYQWNMFSGGRSESSKNFTIPETLAL